MDEKQTKRERDWATKYFNWYESRNRRPNLIGPKNVDDFWKLLVHDSMLPYYQIPELEECLKETQMLVDMGTGGGFPLLPLAYLHQWNFSLNFLGIDAREKKLEALREFTHLNPLFDKNSHINFCASRFEDFIFDIPAVLTFKAVGPCLKYLKLLNYQANIYCFFYKGPDFFEQEGKDLTKISKHWDLFVKRPLQFDWGKGRYFIGFKSKNVPRGTFAEKCKKLSQLF